MSAEHQEYEGKAREIHCRPDREIDAANRHDQGHPNRDDSEERKIVDKNARQILRRWKSRDRYGEDGQHRDQRKQGRVADEPIRDMPMPACRYRLNSHAALPRGRRTEVAATTKRIKAPWTPLTQ